MVKKVKPTPLASVSSSKHINAKLLLGNFYKAVAECSTERNPIGPLVEALAGAQGTLRFLGTQVENHCGRVETMATR